MTLIYHVDYHIFRCECISRSRLVNQAVNQYSHSTLFTITLINMSESIRDINMDYRYGGLVSPTSTEEPEAILLLEVAANLSALAGAVTGAELGQSRVFWRGSLSRVSFSPIEACLNQDIFLRLLLGGFASVREPGSCVAAIIQLWDLTSLRGTSHLILSLFYLSSQVQQ